MENWMERAVDVFTDGGCSGNPGPGGWAYVILENGTESAAGSGGERDTTNNRMELTAVTQAIIAAKNIGAKRINIFTDSQYVKNGITVWIKDWKRKGWVNSQRQPVKNREYWEKLDSLANAEGAVISWNWVKGHAGIEYNEKCDMMVRQEMEKFR